MPIQFPPPMKQMLVGGRRRAVLVEVVVVVVGGGEGYAHTLPSTHGADVPKRIIRAIGPEKRITLQEKCINCNVADLKLHHRGLFNHAACR